VEELLRRPLDRFKQGLATQARYFSQNRNGMSRIAIGVINDRGLPGGELAEWVVPKMLHALGVEGRFELVSLPREWGGGALPEGVDIVLMGNIQAVAGKKREGENEVLELSWVARDATLRLLSPDSVTFPQEIAPPVDPRTRFIPVQQNAPLRPPIATMSIPARPAGGLCIGERSELFIQTEREVHVRVINISGAGESGMVIHASQGAVFHPVAVSIGEFQAINTAATLAEQFIVIAAEKEEDLGPFKDTKELCQLESGWVKALHKREFALPREATVYYSGYRLMKTDDCKEHMSSVTPGLIDALKEAVNGLPMCGLK
jgi:hypothetical protein